MGSDREIINMEPEVTEEYTLESILAEYKSSAYIMGEKRLSKEELDRQAEQILKEMTQAAENELPGETDLPVDGDEPVEYIQTEPETAQEQELEKPELSSGAEGNAHQVDDSAAHEQHHENSGKKFKKRKRFFLNIVREEMEEADDESESDSATNQNDGNIPRSRPRKGEVVKASKKNEPEKLKKSDYRSQKEYEKKKEKLSILEEKQQRILEKNKKRKEIQASYFELSDVEQEFFGVGKYARSTSVIENQDEVNEVIEKQTKQRKRREERHRPRTEQKTVFDNDEKDYFQQERKEPELSYEDAIKLYGSGVLSIKRRSLLSFLICCVMAYFAFAYEFDLAIPDIFSNNPEYFALFSLLSLMLVLFIGLDVFVTGLFDIFRGRIGAESLVTVASLASIADALYIIVAENNGRGSTYCVVAAFSMVFALWGYRLGKSAYRKTFKTIVASKIPVVVSAEWEKTDEGIVLTKKFGTIKSFIPKSLEMDYAERAYEKFAPLLIIASIIFSLLSSVFKGMPQNFTQSFAAMTAVSASFSAIIAFNLPFNTIARRLAAYGAAIAGWSGACDIEDAIGIVVKDNDLFPENTLSLNGVKVFSDDPVDKVVSYAGSMILASGSGLTRVFSDLLKEYACSIYRVDEFSCYEGGGIGAIIKGDKVLVGSSAFMKLMGIKFDSNLNIKSAVYISINDVLAGVFIINYIPIESVRAALLELVKSKITPLFAVRDFNITPSMVKTKFQIPTEEIEFPTFESRYYLSSDSDDPEIKPSAIMSRGGLELFVDLVRSGRQMMSTVRRTVVLSVLGAVVGLLLMFFICWNGAFASASPANTLTFMLFWLLPVLLLNSIGIRY